MALIFSEGGRGTDMPKDYEHISESGERYLRHPEFLNLWIKDDGTECWTSMKQGKFGLPYTDMEEPIRQLKFCTRCDGYQWVSTNVAGDHHKLRFARVCWEAYHQETIPKGMLIDHINFDIYNNRRENLRLATKAESNRHSRGRIQRDIKCKSYSKYRGVSARKYSRWSAEIRLNSKIIYIGMFSTPEDAARAYDERAKELHGEFSITNKSLGLL